MRAEFADLLERFASEVIQLQGVSRTNPHAFAEGKDELARAMQRKANEFRLSMAGTAAIAADVAAIRPGTRRIDGRDVLVERRRRRS